MNPEPRTVNHFPLTILSILADPTTNARPSPEQLSFTDNRFARRLLRRPRARHPEPACGKPVEPVEGSLSFPPAVAGRKPFVTSPIVGATKPQHLEDAVAALSLKLLPEEIAMLEQPYIPHAVVGFV